MMGGQVNSFSQAFHHTPLAQPMSQLKIRLYQLLKHIQSLNQIKQIHAQIILQSLGGTNNLIGALIQSYSAHKKLKSARNVFNKYPTLPPTFLWNLLIQAYTKTPFTEQSLHLFKQMLLVGGCHSLAVPDDYTFTFAITACSRQRTVFSYGQNCHTMVVKLGYDSDVCVGNALVSMYVVYSEMVYARKVFDEMPQRDIITWTSMLKGCVTSGKILEAEQVFVEMPERNEVSWAVMIAGYVGHKMYNDALRCFNDMLDDDNVRPNEAILVCVLLACAHLGQINQGEWIHFYIEKNRFPKSSNVSTALIDMYAKCGKIDYAKQVFNGAGNRDLLTWTSMISGLSMHGLGKEALKVFDEMLEQGIKPDNITLVGVLNACSHSGQVNEGLSIFNSMEREWGISPKIEHFGCLVDLLSRAGRLEDAFKAVKMMQMEPDDVIWRALLSACRIHGNVGLAERVIEHVKKTGGGGRLLLSNLHASFGQWDNVRRIRESKIHKEDDSTPGCSYIEIEGVVHEFLAADKLHPQIREITRKLNEVMKRISLDGDDMRTV
ncbi:putative tetratricopeptide-like helical domain superfamily [Helianthus anomalus]